MKKFLLLLIVIFSFFIFFSSRPPSPCKCVEIKDKYDEDSPWARPGQQWDLRRPWRKCYKAYESKAIKEWKEKRPNYSRAQYYLAWGAYENTGMVESYLKRKCNTNKKIKIRKSKNKPQTISKENVEYIPQTQRLVNIEFIINQKINTQAYSTENFNKLNPQQLRIARNTIFAYYGRPFKSKDLQKHFAEKAWYSINNEYNYNLIKPAHRELINRVKLLEK